VRGHGALKPDSEESDVGDPEQIRKRLWRRSSPGLFLAATVVAAAGCSESPTYEGVGTDHPVVGRSLDEIEPCTNQVCLDGVVVRVVHDLSKGERRETGDASCYFSRLDLIVDEHQVVAAKAGCSP